MDVVRIVAERIHPLRAALGDVFLVGRNRLLVRGDDVSVTSDAQVDVRGHVDDVSRTRHQGQQRSASRSARSGVLVGSHR